MFKKVLVLALCLLCVLTGCGGETATTTSTPTLEESLPVGGDFKIWLDEVTCKAGETCSVNIRISQHSNVAASDLLIEFDNTLVSYEGFKAGTVYTSEAAKQSDSVVKVTSITLTPPEDEAVMGTLEFKVKETATGTIPLKLTSTTCSDYDLNDLAPVCFKGSITVG